MKIEKAERKEPLYDGGDGDAAPEEAPSGPKNRKDHYADKYGAYKATDRGIDAEKGMVYERSCTDFLCGVVFLAFIASMFAVAIYGCIVGEPTKLIAPFDFGNRVCGFGEMKDYPKLYFTEIKVTWSDSGNAAAGDYDAIVVRKLHDATSCVKKCPKTKEEAADMECPPGDAGKECIGRVNIGTNSFMDLCVPIYDELGSSAQ